MNREIKFRAWDDNAKAFVSDWVMYPNGGCEYPQGGWDLGGYKEGDNFKLMQHTGLKDKNGKDIYEGDIVSSTSEFMGHYATHIKKIVWASKGGFHPEGTHVDNLAEFITDTGGKNKSEVIGNIYENPDLLH